MSLKKILLQAVICLLMAGCTKVGVEYAPPKTDVSMKWHGSLNNPITVETDNPELLKSWWTVFDDETLNSLMDMAMKKNPDVRSAYYAFTAARATLSMTEADKLPTFTASSSVKRSYYGDSSLKNQEVDTYTAGLDASWEIDIFGRARRSVEASFASMQSTEEAMHDVMISLLAELATNYINIRSLQHRVEITEEDIRIKQILYDIAERKFRSGLSDVLEAKAALYNLEYVKTEIYDLKTALEKAFNRLAVLTGQKPGALHDMVSIKTSIPPISLNIVSGIPADMVRRRPDVREAERNLAAQTARIGVAEADKYPKFTLSGSVGYQADSGSSLFNASNSTLSFGPNFSWAVFDLGAVKQNIKVQTEKQKEYLAKYESAVLTAMEDVENAMTAFDHEYSKNIQLKKAYDIAEETYNLALKKYEAGLSDYTDVITAETAYINYKSEFIQSTANANIDIISLYKALGGGWESFKIQEQQ